MAIISILLHMFEISDILPHKKKLKTFSQLQNVWKLSDLPYFVAYNFGSVFPKLTANWTENTEISVFLVQFSLPLLKSHIIRILMHCASPCAFSSYTYIYLLLLLLLKVSNKVGGTSYSPSTFWINCYSCQYFVRTYIYFIILFSMHCLYTIEVFS